MHLRRRLTFTYRWLPSMCVFWESMEIEARANSLKLISKSESQKYWKKQSEALENGPQNLIFYKEPKQTTKNGKTEKQCFYEQTWVRMINFGSFISSSFFQYLSIAPIISGFLTVNRKGWLPFFYCIFLAFFQQLKLSWQADTWKSW